MNSDTTYLEASELINSRISPILISNISASRAKSYRTSPGDEGRALKFGETESVHNKLSRIIVGDAVSLAMVGDKFELYDGGYPCFTLSRRYTSENGVVTFYSEGGAQVQMLTCDAKSGKIEKFQQALRRQCKKAGVDPSTIPFLSN